MFFLERGDGFFLLNKPRTGTSWKPAAIAVGDVNNDSRLDLIVVNSNNDDVSVLLGYGNGTFRPQRRYPSGSKPQGLAVGDVNNDGRLDLIVANSGTNDLSVLLGHGNGSFATERRYASGSVPRAVALGDVKQRSSRRHNGG